MDALERKSQVSIHKRDRNASSSRLSNHESDQPSGRKGRRNRQEVIEHTQIPLSPQPDELNEDENKRIRILRKEILRAEQQKKMDEEIERAAEIQREKMLNGMQKKQG